MKEYKLDDATLSLEQAKEILEKSDYKYEELKNQLANLESLLNDMKSATAEGSK